MVMPEGETPPVFSSDGTPYEQRTVYDPLLDRNTTVLVIPEKSGEYSHNGEVARVPQTAA